MPRRAGQFLSNAQLSIKSNLNREAENSTCPDIPSKCHPPQRNDPWSPCSQAGSQRRGKDYPHLTPPRLHLLHCVLQLSHLPKKPKMNTIVPRVLKAQCSPLPLQKSSREITALAYLSYPLANVENPLGCEKYQHQSVSIQRI
jgi:hypothetical protein